MSGKATARCWARLRLRRAGLALRHVELAGAGYALSIGAPVKG